MAHRNHQHVTNAGNGQPCSETATSSDLLIARPQTTNTLLHTIGRLALCLLVLCPLPLVDGAVKVKPADPTLPYHEGNRPQIYLNGLWDFMPLTNGTSRQIPDAPPTPFKPELVKMPVPGWWDNFGEFDIPPKWSNAWNAWYRRTFTVPPGWKNKRLKLRFGAVTQYAKVFVNRQVIGHNIHGIAPFTLDITDAARTGKNLLEVFVQGYIHALAEGIEVVSVEQFVETNRGSWGTAEFKVKSGVAQKEREVRDLHQARRGICRDVVLEAAPLVRVDDIAIVTSFRKSTLDVTVRLANESGHRCPLTLKLAVTDADGNQVVKLNQPVTVPAGQAKQVYFSHAWKNARLWNHWDPHLYTCTVTAHPTQFPWFDRKRVRFGFREVWIGPEHDILLNGLPLRMVGTNVGDGWATEQTPSYTREFFRQLKILGFNSVRTIDGMPRWFYDIADEMGMFVKDGFLHWLEWDYRNEEQKRNVRESYRRTIEARRNHPSIVIWSLSNEQCRRAIHKHHGGDRPSEQWVATEGPYMKELQNFVASIDRTRILTHAGGHDFNGVAPTYNWHYCSPRGTFLDWRREFGKPFLIGEWEFGWYNRAWTAQRVRARTDLCLRIARAAEISGAWPMAILKWSMWGFHGDEWKWPNNEQGTINLEWETMDGPFIKPAHPWRPHVNPWTADKPRIKPGHLYETVKEACAPNMVFVDLEDRIAGASGGQLEDFRLAVVNDYLHEVKLQLVVDAEMDSGPVRLAEQDVTLGPAEVKDLRIKFPPLDRSEDRQLQVRAELREAGGGKVVNTHTVRTIVSGLEMTQITQ